MAQPVWITPPGNLGTVPENVFFQIPLRAFDPDRPNDPDAVYYVMLAGELPPGVQCTRTGLIEGTPKAIASLQGVPQEVAQDVKSRFAVRAFTERYVNGQEVVDRVADQTFEITVTGQDAPRFVTPAGNVGTFYDGTAASVQIQYTDPDPGDLVRITRIAGELPPGLVLNQRTGLISGIIEPLTGVPGTQEPGWFSTQWDQWPWDFTRRSASKNYQFILEITDGKESDVRAYEIFVYSKDSMSADTTSFSADNTFITADVVPTRTPVMITTTSNLGTIRADNYYAFQFQAIDWDGDAVEFVVNSQKLPPGLSLDPFTGWLYGYIPDQGATEFTYDFDIQVRKQSNPSIISDPYDYTMTVTGDINTEVIWLTDPDLGVMDNGGISYFRVAAVNTGGRALQYQLVSGSDSKLPQGLTLQPSGNIVGRASFNTFALDGGTTTFDKDIRTRLVVAETTFDLTFSFTVNAFASQTQQQGFQISAYTVTNPGTGYTSTPEIVVSAPPDVEGAIQAVPGPVVVRNGFIVSISLGNPGRGYTSPPTVTIVGGGGVGATAVAGIRQATLVNAVSVFRRFSITVNREYNRPYESLYIKCMPPENDRALISSLVQNQDIIPQQLLYRADDLNFGVSQSVVYVHAYGLNPATVDTYVSSLNINHYLKDLTLGPVETARALDSAGNVLYEIIYSRIIDNQVNSQGQSVSKEKTLPYPVTLEDSSVITTVYPNSLINMRDQVIDVVGQTAPVLPLWMTSKQADGRVLGFVPAWVIAYVNPGQSARVAYNVRTKFGSQLNAIDFQVDRYELDRSQTYNWDIATNKWIPYPARVTSFDLNAHYQLPDPADSSLAFDGGNGYAVGNQIRILGSQIGGQNTVNNMVLTVNTVDESGTIESVFYRGTAPDSTVGEIYTNIVGTNISGSGTGAIWNLQVVGNDETTFDGSATTFVAPSDRWQGNEEFNKYLVFPKRTILG